jgi:hypothetical protein
LQKKNLQQKRYVSFDHRGNGDGPNHTLPLLPKDILGHTSPKDTPSYSFSPAASCHQLAESLKARKEPSSLSQVSRESPLIILAFDEAHTLTNREQKNRNWSKLSALTAVLCDLSHFPLFTLFLSTWGTTRISQFTSPFRDTSNSIIVSGFNLTEPFTDLGFDTLAEKVSLDDHWNLERVTADSHIVHLGRPL